MKIGLGLPANYPASLVEAVLQAADIASPDSVWFPDHMLGIFPPSLWDQYSISHAIPDPDAFMDPFALCARASSGHTVPMGIAVTDGIRRAAPDVARSSLTLQHLCAGGFNIGVGSGEAENLLPFGYSFDKPVAATEKFVQLLRHLLDYGEMPSGPGRLGYPTASSNGKPRIWVAGHRPRMLRLTGEYADGWIPIDISSPDDYRDMKHEVHEYARAAGRPYPEAGLFVYTILGESRKRLHEHFKKEPLAKLMALASAPSSDWERHGLKHPLGAGFRAYLDYIPHDHDPDLLRNIASDIPIEVLEEKVLLGSPSEVAQRVDKLAAAGCEHFIMFNMTGLVGGKDEGSKRVGELLEFIKIVQAI
ncbi:LLM class flavin-dependent oxidoreductase [Mycobacteroides chelonae]